MGSGPGWQNNVLVKIRKIKHSFFLVTTHARVHSWILMCPLALHAWRPGQPHYIPDEETGCRGRGPRPEWHRPRHGTQNLAVASYFTSAQLGSQETASPPSHREMVSEGPGIDPLFQCPKLGLRFPFPTPMTSRESALGPCHWGQGELLPVDFLFLYSFL